MLPDLLFTCYLSIPKAIIRCYYENCSFYRRVAPNLSLETLDQVPDLYYNRFLCFFGEGLVLLYTLICLCWIMYSEISTACPAPVQIVLHLLQQCITFDLCHHVWNLFLAHFIRFLLFY